MPTLIDTHCHVDLGRYDEDRPAVIERAAEAGVTRIINPGLDLANCRTVLQLADSYAGLYAAVGVHPNSSADFAESMLDDLAEMAEHPKVVAIGEIGLDYHWDESPKETQFRAFRAQLDLAARLELPVIIHNREASEDVIDILETWASDLPAALQTRPGVMHSFDAPAEVAQRALAIGFYIGFTGPITYKKNDELRRIAASVPLDRILVETDGPFLPPQAYRGKRNEPAYIPHMVARLASLHDIPDDEMAAATTANALRLFNMR
jgi:TatD DNase family protein